MKRMVTASPGVTLDFTADTVMVDSIGPETDPAWRYTDSNGHEHSGANLRATLTEVTVEMYDPDDGETWDAHDHWECSVCGERIKPGVWFPGPRQITTGVTATATIIDDNGVKTVWHIPSATATAIVNGTVTDVRAAVEADGMCLSMEYRG